MKNLIKKCKLTFILFAFPLFAFSQKEIKVMSYNIRLDVASDNENRWDARKDKVAGLMNFYEADFIGGQEVQHHQLKYLQEKLNGYSYIGVGRDDGKEAGEYSCIFYKKEKFSLLQQSTFWLSPTPDSVSKGWDAAFKRVCTFGLFKDLKSKKKFWVLNTHFDHVGLVAREESAKLIIAKIKQLNSRKNYPVVLMGDFNSRPADAAITYLNQVMLNARVVSKEPAYGPADTWNGFKFNEKPDGCIDYIFVSEDRRISVSKFATLTDSYDMKYPSDHLPVLAVFLLKK